MSGVDKKKSWGQVAYETYCETLPVTKRPRSTWESMTYTDTGMATKARFSRIADVVARIACDELREDLDRYRRRR